MVVKGNRNRARLALILLLSILFLVNIQCNKPIMEDTTWIKQKELVIVQTNEDFTSSADKGYGFVRRSSQEVETQSAQDAGIRNESTTEEAHTYTNRMSKTLEGLGYSFLFIFLSEIGDKTFLFIILYATRMNGFKLLSISSIALCGMHVVGVAVGGLFQYLFSPFWLKLTTVISFFVIGVMLIYQGITDEAEVEDFDDKLKELEIELISEKRKDTSRQNPSHVTQDKSEDEDDLRDHNEKDKSSSLLAFFKSIISSEALKIIITIVCLEMGDRSQISAVALAANYQFWIVALAGSLGHIFAIILAILFGKVVSDYTSEKWINIIGGVLFLAFSAYSVLIYYVLETEQV